MHFFFTWKQPNIWWPRCSFYLFGCKSVYGIKDYKTVMINEIKI